ncbi:SusC/RagA family TonB-linked outer membrane protein [Membranihabitans marinus]|uniref:SusC/RagA family TonB-linked outer membrane protein n=1 Tax=Membranihabitans marinus TaxID=1227546 RepID=UPI001F027628|nr:SusC/RagA family TonB-linked outer membrane protein [Membranihabitans marinus]
MKRFIFFIVLMLCWSIISFAQNSVSGTVVDEEGDPLIGANVLVKGGSTGSITDFDGKYVVEIPEGTEALIFSYTGYETQEISIGGRTVIDVILVSGQLLQEIVVTSLGVSKEKKQLGYAVSSVDNESLNRTSDVSPLDGLKGKVAGLEISQSSGQPGASRKVRLRGVGSINGSASPLVVIDGVPQFDSFTGATSSLDRQTDFGNALSDLNANDIANVTVLKGAAASALYGNRAASGVIMITTKSGEYGPQGLNVEFSTGFTTSEIARVPFTQSEFGNGWSGVRDLNENGSWGPRLDGVERVWGRVVNDQQRVKTYVARHEDSYRAAFDFGQEYQNSLAFSGGNDVSRFRVSFANVNSDGIIPTSSDYLNRNTLAFNGGLKLDNWEISSSFNYINKNQRLVPGGQGDNGGFGYGYINELQQIPVDFWINDLEDIDNPFNNADNYYTSFASNPYQVLKQNRTASLQNRLYGNVSLKYNIMDNLSLTSRIGGDYSNNAISAYGAVVTYTPGSPNYILGSATNPGAVNEQSLNRRQWNIDIFASYNEDLHEKLNMNLTAGWNAWEYFAKSESITSRNLTLPGFYNVNNTPDPPSVATATSMQRSHGLYGQLEFAWDYWVYLTLSGRNDFFSTIPLENNSGFYPSASLSLDLTDKVFSNVGFVDFLKLRAGFAQVASDAAPYLTSVGYAPAIIRSGGFGSLELPIGGITGYEVDDALADNNLILEVTDEIEFGIESTLFGNRLRLDLTYYDRTTNDQIVTAEIPPSTGYTALTTNIGSISNKGYELNVGITPIRNDNFEWNINWNFTQNKNKVIDLGDVNEVTIFGFAGGIDIRAVEGLTASEFYGPSVKTNAAGQLIVNANTGFAVEGEDFVSYGSAYPDFIMGLTTGLRFKNFNLDATLDYRKGGLIFSGMADINYFVGNALETAYNDRNPFIVPNSVIDNGDGTYTPNTTPIAYNDIWSYWNDFSGNDAFITRKTVVDRTYFKLRQVTLSYTLPPTLFNGLIESAKLAIYGRNLLLWTPKEQYFIDPEISSFGTGQAGEFGELYGTPSTRDYGVKLSLTF